MISEDFLNILNSNLEVMKYVIAFAVVLTMITLYHFVKYKKSEYNKFEDYLKQETNGMWKYLVHGWFFLVLISAIVTLIYFLGELIGFFW